MTVTKPTPDRRAILGGSLALASAVAATAAPTVLAAPADHPDAVLMRLTLELEATTRRMDALSNASWEAEEAAFHEPPIPEALYWCAGDDQYVALPMAHLKTCKVDGRDRYTYAPYGLDKLREALAKDEAHSVEGSSLNRKRIERLRELVAAGDGWQTQREAAYEAAGCAALDRTYYRERDRKEVLERQIAVLPARTPEGVCAKVRAITAADSWNVEAIKENVFAKRLAEAGPDDLAHMLLLSVILDAADIAAPVAAGEAA